MSQVFTNAGKPFYRASVHCISYHPLILHLLYFLLLDTHRALYGSCTSNGIYRNLQGRLFVK